VKTFFLFFSTYVMPTLFNNFFLKKHSFHFNKIQQLKIVICVHLKAVWCQWLSTLLWIKVIKMNARITIYQFLTICGHIYARDKNLIGKKRKSLQRYVHIWNLLSHWVESINSSILGKVNFIVLIRDARWFFLHWNTQWSFC